jgi:hypothetical protein
MEDWIEFEEGQYAITSAYLVSPENNAVHIVDPILEIYTGRFGKRQVKGFGLIQNTALVELHEDGDQIDLILDLGSEFRFLMENPVMQSGKVFAPNIRSLLHFFPREPWLALSADDFNSRIERLTFVSA